MNRCYRKQRDRVELKHDDPDFDLNSTDFDPRRSKTVFIVHGFMSNGEMEWVKNLVDAILDKVSANTGGVDKSLARPTSRCILFDGENILFDVSLVIYIYYIQL